jgi:hypothetical protein
LVPKDDKSKKEFDTTLDDLVESMRYWFGVLPSDAHVREVPKEDVQFEESVDPMDVIASIGDSIRKWKLVAREDIIKLLALGSGQIDPRGDR